MDLPFLNDIKGFLPEAVRDYTLYIVLGVLGIVAVFGLMILLVLVKLLFSRGSTKKSTPKLEEDLTEYPDLRSTSGDQNLRMEGVPVRLRLVVVAPAGTASEFDEDELPQILDKIVPGLGKIYKNDKPRVRVWPTQVSYQGFATHFHRNTVTGAEEGEETRWVMVAGRAKLGKSQIMLGLALQTIKPNNIGRRTVDSHEWATMLRVRVKD